MVGNIINQLGGGSGIDSKSLVDQLTELQSAPQEQRLTSRQELLEARISDYGLLRSALGKLESAVAAVSNPDTFNAKAVSLPQTSLIALTKLEAKAAAGDYQLQIKQTARSQSLSSDTVASPNGPVGKGTLMIQFGSWNEGMDTFGVNPSRDGVTITIDDTNNSLAGLRDAINQADAGVQATIVSDGQGGYRLQMTAPSGANNQLSISVGDDAEPGLASFAFNEATVAANEGLSQNQAGRDALILVNGLEVARSSNRVTDVIEGLEFDIFNSSAEEVINISVSADRGTAEQAIRDFVEAYNVFVDDMEKLTGFDEELGDFGSLRNDSLAKNLMQTIRGTIGAAIPGVEDGFNTLANVGIRTRLDGKLEINENPDEPNTNFRAAMDKHFELVRDLFVPSVASSDIRIDATGHGARTQPGNYEVEITQDAERGRFVAEPIAVGFPLDTGAGDYSFQINVDGINSATISLPADKAYSTGAELAADFQALINLDETLRAANVRVTVNVNADGELEFNSASYGGNSIVSFLEVGEDLHNLGISAGAGEAGKDVAGTVDGRAAFGFGNVLLPAIGSPAEGLSMVISPGSAGTTATVNFSRGFAGGMTSLIDTFLKNSGLIKEREDNTKKDIARVEEDKVTLERRSEAFRQRLQSQFLAMELIVRNLNNTGSFLDGLNDRLPFTAPRR